MKQKTTLAVFVLFGALALFGQSHAPPVVQAAATFPCEASPWQVLFRFPEMQEQVANRELWRVDLQELAETGRLDPGFAGYLASSNREAVAKVQGKEMEYFVISVDPKTTPARVCMDHQEAVSTPQPVSMPNPSEVDPNEMVKLATALVGTNQPQPQPDVVVQQPPPKKPGLLSSMLRYAAFPLGFAFKSTPLGLGASAGAGLLASQLDSRGDSSGDSTAASGNVITHPWRGATAVSRAGYSEIKLN